MAERLRLGDETFGDRLHRAYRMAREEFGITYAEAAARISQVTPTSDQMLMRLEKADKLPGRPNQRLVAYMALLTYGFDPADFGLSEKNTPLTAFDMAKVRRLLNPRKRG